MMKFFIEKYNKIINFFKNDFSVAKKFVDDEHDRRYGNIEIWGSYRHTCIKCGKELFTDEIFCEECSKDIVMLSGDLCPRCGRKVIGNVSCNICRNNHHYFDRAFSAFNYEGLVIKYILNMKFYGKAYLYHAFAQYLALVYIKSNMEIDLVTFVPMTEKSIKERGYNQSEMLAKEFSHLTGIPLFSGVEKKRETLFQKRLNAEDRRENMKNVFKVNGDIKGKKILIIDDVMTTCATIDSVAKTLKRANSSKIYAITIASTQEKIAKK